MFNLLICGHGIKTEFKYIHTLVNGLFKSGHKIATLNTALMLSSRCSFDCLLGTVTSQEEPSITGATCNEPVFDPICVINLAVYTRQARCVIFRIPISCRIQTANALSDTINNALSSQTPLSWAKVFFLDIEVLGIPTQPVNDHRTSKTVQQIHDDLRRHLLTSSTDTPFYLMAIESSASIQSTSFCNN